MSRCIGAVVAISPADVPRLERQSRPPDAVLAGPDGLERALREGADWVWLLARGADPRPDALERLVDAHAPAGDAPASLLAGRVVDPDGTTVASEVPAGDQRNPQLVRLVGRRMLPIRHTTFANCLVARGCFTRHGVPDERRYGPYAAVEWSARALRVETGYFIPSSVISVDPRPSRRDALAEIPALVRMLRSGTWTRGEALVSIGRARAVLLRPTTIRRRG